MTVLRRAAQLAAIALLAVSAGCTAGAPAKSVPLPATPSSPTTSGEPTSPAPTSTPAPGARGLLWPDGSAVEATVVDLKNARAAVDGDYRIVAEVPATWQGKHVLTLAAGPNETVLVAVFPEDNDDEATGLLKHHTEVGIMDREEFKPFASTVDAVPDDAPRQTGGGTIASGYAAWMETPSTQVGSLDWRIFTKDLKTDAAPVLVAKAESLDSAWGPVISGGRVYWETSEGPGDGTWSIKILSAPLVGGDVRVELDLASMPAAVDGGLVVEQLTEGAVVSPDDAAPTDAVIRSTGISVFDGKGAAKPLVTFARPTTDDWFVREIAGDGPTVAMAIGHDLYVLGTSGTKATRIEMAGGTTAGGLAVCGDLVTWADVPDGESDADHQYVYDVGTEELLVVDVPANAGASSCNGRTILWEAFNDDDLMVATLTEW